MRAHRLVAPLALLAALSAAPAHIRSQQPGSNSFDAERAVVTMFQATARADTTTLRTVVGDDLRWIVASTGAVADKAQLLAAAGTIVPMASNEYAVDSLQTWWDGAVAVADYCLTNVRAFHEYRQVLVARATDVFRLRNGYWLLVRHTTTW